MRGGERNAKSGGGGAVERTERSPQKTDNNVAAISKLAQADPVKKQVCYKFSN